ncbi:MAG: sulfite exporter TauE/SafE family protein [Bacteroidetes bacterium]|nr:sulfite exporter TauE/SafE family protein [Bacteroidota bacterium]
MCGPLILALPLQGRGNASIFIYQAARVLSYVILGMLFGLLGKGIALAGVQQALSTGAGVLMLLIAITAWRFERLISQVPGFGQFTKGIQKRMGNLLQRHGYSAVFGMGMLHGFLPCGMVYAALAGAVASTDVVGGALFMALFGLGTLPLLLSVHFTGHNFSKLLRARMRFWQPILLGFVGLLLIQRGLHLDLSLWNSAVPKAGYDCH